MTQRIIGICSFYLLWSRVPGPKREDELQSYEVKIT